MIMDKATKVALGSGFSLVFGVLFGWVAFPKILHALISQQMTLAKGTDIREMWTTVPFPLDFKIYIFNCTNYEDVMNGGKPVVKEIGPYYYEEWKEKVNMIDLEKEDAIYYNRRDTFIFDKEKSGPGLTGNEIVVIPHLVIISTVVSVAAEKPSMLALIGKAINGIYENPKTVFLTAKVSDILFNGVNINCDRTDFAPKAVCSVMLKLNKTFEIMPNNQLKFSIFGMKNGTIEEAKFKVLRGTKNIMDVGRVLEFNGEASQTIWGGPECNDFGGTDSTVFPPFLTEKDELLSFTPDICRSLAVWYDRKSSYAGIPANRYVGNLGDLANQPKWHCFCETPDTCPKKGLMNISRCVNAPLIASLPHYLDADPTVQDSVKGLRPDEEKHGIIVDFEPITGTPLMGKKRLQFNIILPRTDKIDLFKNFTNLMIPMFWVEEGLALNKTFINMLEKQLFIYLRIVKVVKWMMIIFGILGMGISLIHKFKHRIINFAVAPKATANPQQMNENALNGNLHKNLKISTLQNLQQGINK